MVVRSVIIRTSFIARNAYRFGEMAVAGTVVKTAKSICPKLQATFSSIVSLYVPTTCI